MDNFLRNPCEPKESVEFMVREWYNQDYNDDEESESLSYTIFAFGNTTDGESVCLRIDDFTPYFYIKVPDSWNQSNANNLAFNLRKKLWGNARRDLISWKIMLRKDAYGFNNNRMFKFVRFVFKSHSAYKSTQWALKKPIEGFEDYKFRLYETNIDPMLVFIHLRDIQASGWINVNKLNSESNLSRCQHNYSCHWKDVKPSHHLSLLPPFVTMSFDLECYSWDGSFPDPENSKNVITQIGSALQRFGSDTVLKTVVVLGPVEDIPGVVLIRASTEKELITRWIELIANTDPDQIIGYNIADFDWTYIWKRAQYLGLTRYIGENLPRLYCALSEFKEDKFESAAYGYMGFNIITTPGIGQIDLLHWFRKNTKLDRYSLDFVSKKYLGQQKREVSVHEIFKWSGPEGTPQQRALVADYCAQDTVLPLKLMENRCMFPNLVEMSRVTYVPLTWLLTRGEQVKAYSQLNRELRKLKFVLPGNIKGDNVAFQGATVLNCERGFHKDPVSGLDFASLYPSIMIAWNLCPTTWVALEKYDNIPDVEYKRFDTGQGCHTFVQSVPGIVPGVLDRLWKERKVVKKQMNSEKDPQMKAILNGKQLAIKVSMNSIYGFFGVGSGVLPCKAIAASVTFTGRQMLKYSKECAEKWYDGSEEAGGVRATVVYGDSVRGDTPLTLRDSEGNLRVISIEKYNSEGYKPYGVRADKEHSVADGDYILTASGWKRVRRVIRHRTKKRMFRVTTQKGTVVVTEDHSLLDTRGNQIKPNELGQQELMWGNF